MGLYGQFTYIFEVSDISTSKLFNNSELNFKLFEENSLFNPLRIDSFLFLTLFNFF